MDPEKIALELERGDVEAGSSCRGEHCTVSNVGTNDTMIPNQGEGEKLHLTSYTITHHGSSVRFKPTVG